MLRLSGIHIPNRHWAHMAFKAYYDGSGKPDQPCTTLTGVAASEELWPDFEERWLMALDRNDVPDRDFHMTDLMSGNGRFKGWKGQARRKLLNDLFNVLGRYRGSGLSAYSCTVFYGAYEQAKVHVPRLREPEAICVHYCVGGLQLTHEQLTSEPRPIILYFDRNEEFMHKINRTWERLRTKRTGWPWQVQNIIVADRSKYYPIQAADMLGWIVNRCRRDADATGADQPEPTWICSEELDPYKALFRDAWLMVNHRMKCYADERQIIERYPNG